MKGIKAVILRFFTFIAVLYLVDKMINGFELSATSSTLALATLLAITQLAIKPVVKFLTFPINLVTFGIFNFFISCIFIYLYNFIVPGFRLVPGSIGPIATADIQVPEVRLSQIGVIILASIVISILNNIVSWTQGDGE
jgi:putative membrane protein